MRLFGQNSLGKFSVGCALCVLVSAALLACDSTVSPSDDDDPVSSSSRSSSSLTVSSSFSVTSSASEGKSSSSLELSSLATPSSLSSVRLAPSVWLLEWGYTADTSRREKGFIIQQLDLESNTWTDFGTTDQDVYLFLLDGTKTTNHYYRVAAYDSSGRSDFSSYVLVTNNTKYRSDLVLTTPTAIPNVVVDGLLELVLTSDRPNKLVEISEYNYDASGVKTGDLYYQVRWVVGSVGGAGEDLHGTIDTLSFPLDQPSVAVNAAENQCNAYGQIRVVWKDKNGVADYSEWSDPVGSKAGTNSNLVDLAEPRCVVK